MAECTCRADGSKTHAVVVNYLTADRTSRITRAYYGVRILKAAWVHVKLVVHRIDALCVTTLEQVCFFLPEATVILDLHMDKVKRTWIVVATAFWHSIVNFENSHAPSPCTAESEKAIARRHAYFQPVTV